ncbi:hypothetical protein MUO93_09705 [Candidatus Bathyarchaeota archaeon]|nr:hypothetical protein [Candidatus Bathyarchaeota archaeon]
MREDREKRTKIDALDLLISVLREHEKSLDRISARLEKQLNRLIDAVTRLEALRTEAAAMKPKKKKRLGRREQPPKGRPG